MMCADLGSLMGCTLGAGGAASVIARLLLIIIES